MHSLGPGAPFSLHHAATILSEMMSSAWLLNCCWCYDWWLLSPQLQSNDNWSVFSCKNNEQGEQAKEERQAKQPGNEKEREKNMGMSLRNFDSWMKKQIIKKHTNWISINQHTLLHHQGTALIISPISWMSVMIHFGTLLVLALSNLVEDKVH